MADYYKRGRLSLDRRAPILNSGMAASYDPEARPQSFDAVEAYHEGLRDATAARNVRARVLRAARKAAA